MVNQITASRSIVVTQHREAAVAGVGVLQKGGNAIDAAVAAAMTLCVVSPTNVGFGGYGGTMIVYLAKTGKIRALDFDSRAPRAFRADAYADPKVAHHGYLSVGVPGVVAGLAGALKRYGTMDWGTVSSHAIEMAEKGIEVTPALANALKSWRASADPASLRAIFPDGKLPPLHGLWRQPEVARLVRDLARDPRAFYTGDPAQRIVRQVQAHGGLLAMEDFERFDATESEALTVNYREYDLYTPPPPAGGITTLAILKTLEQFDLPRFERWGARYDDLFLEAAKLCWQDRVRWLGDPEVVKVPMREMLSAEAATERVRRIRAGDTAPPAGLPNPPGGAHTVNVVSADAAGNVVSMTLTHGESFGSHVAIDGLGLFLGHGMSRFDYIAGHPNAPAPGKRMHHNMSPVLVFKDGKRRAGVGMPGGTKIVTVTAQLLVSLLDFRATPAETVSAPRVHVESAEPVQTGSTVPETVAGELELMGHSVKRVPALGGPAGVAWIGEGGMITAACSAGTEGVGGV